MSNLLNLSKAGLESQQNLRCWPEMYMDCTLVDDIRIKHLIFGCVSTNLECNPLVYSGLGHETLVIML